MAKFLIELPKDVMLQLDVIAQVQDVSRSALIRDAVAMWLEQQKKTENMDAFGILKKNKREDAKER